MKVSDLISELIDLKLQREPVVHGAETEEERKAKLLAIANYKVAVLKLKNALDWRLENDK